MKPCKWHPDSERYANGSCAQCNRDNSAAYRKANPVKAKAAVDRWKVANPEKAKQADKNWRTKNKERCNDNLKSWIKRNPERNRAHHAKWEKANPDKRNATMGKRRAAMVAGTVPLTLQEQATVIGLYATARAMSELAGEPYHVDHIKPLSKGGLHHPSNLQVLRGVDNLRKGAKL